MRSHSFQDTELKLHRYVNDSIIQVVGRLTILRYPLRVRGQERRVNHSKKRKLKMHSHSFQDTELKLHRYVNDSTGQVVGRLTILPYTH